MRYNIYMNITLKNKKRTPNTFIVSKKPKIVLNKIKETYILEDIYVKDKDKIISKIKNKFLKIYGKANISQIIFSFDKIDIYNTMDMFSRKIKFECNKEFDNIFKLLKNK